MHSARRVWQCRGCGAQSSVTAGTVMHGTRMPLRLWFWAAYLVATHHPGISAVQLQRQLGIRRHETAWMMLHKLRAAMVAPAREPLGREVEIDEFFLGGFEEGLRGGRARGKKALAGSSSRSAARAPRASGSRSSRTPRPTRSARCWSPRPNPARSCTPTPGTATTGSQPKGGTPAAQPEHRARGGAIPPARPLRNLEAQSVAARNPSMGISRAPAGVSERVRAPRGAAGSSGV